MSNALNLDLDLSDIAGGPAPPTVAQPVVQPAPKVAPPVISPREPGKITAKDMIDGLIYLEDPSGKVRALPIKTCSGKEFLEWAAREMPIEDPGPPEVYDRLSRREKVYDLVLMARCRQFGWGKDLYQRKYQN